jgi:ubiquinone/menaquinone biosynthesis C-methylase UbiE
MWGTTPDRYEAFARDAAVGQGPLLDAGCGTMVATAAAHRRCNRAVVGVDLSVPMLERARSRVQRAPLISLVQGDVYRMPFVPGSFETVLSMGMLHLFDDAESYLDELRRMVSPGGRVFVSSLVLSGRRIGDGYLHTLMRAGEVTMPRTEGQVTNMLGRIGRVASVRREGNMLFLTVERATESRAVRAAPVAVSVTIPGGQLL